MLDNLLASVQEIECQDICSFVEIAISVDDDLGLILLFQHFIAFQYQIHEQLSVFPLSLVNEVIAYLVFEELEAEGCSIEAKKRRGSSYFPVENVNIIHHICLGVPLDKGNSPSPWKSRLRIAYDVFSRDEDPTRLGSSEVFVRTKVGKVELIVNLEVEIVVATESCTISSKDNEFLFSDLLWLAT